MVPFGSLFTGGGGCDIGARQAGLTPLWGVERDAKICAVAKANGIPALCADATEVDYVALPRVDVLHASPPCSNYSSIRVKAQETEIDIALALTIVRAVREQRPLLFTLENVIRYARSNALRIIKEGLLAEGYSLREYRVLFSDYGVPQTRRRLIVAASRSGALPQSLTPTEQGASWYDAIDDLCIDWEGLKCSSFQIKSMKRIMHIAEEMFIYATDSSFRIVQRAHHSPMFTLSSGINHKVFIFRDGAWYKTHPAMWKRWQTFPDTYQLPASRQQAAKIIGNAVPSMGYTAVLRQLLNAV